VFNVKVVMREVVAAVPSTRGSPTASLKWPPLCPSDQAFCTLRWSSTPFFHRFLEQLENLQVPEEEIDLPRKWGSNSPQGKTSLPLGVATDPYSLISLFPPFEATVRSTVAPSNIHSPPVPSFIISILPEIVLPWRHPVIPKSLNAFSSWQHSAIHTVTGALAGLDICIHEPGS
jgi:hypothetical protein